MTTDATPNPDALAALDAIIAQVAAEESRIIRLTRYMHLLDVLNGEPASRWPRVDRPLMERWRDALAATGLPWDRAVELAVERLGPYANDA